MSAPTPDDVPSEQNSDASSASSSSGPFDLTHLRELVEMMEKHGLTEVSLKTEETQWKLRRGPEVIGGYPPQPVPMAASIPSPAAAPPATASAAPAATPAAPVQEGLLIKSPTVGTFYSSPSPDDPPFVAIGSRVEPDTIVCLVEAMKVFNQIPAEVSGTIAEMLVNNGDSVEFGQPMFRVRPG